MTRSQSPSKNNHTWEFSVEHFVFGVDREKYRTRYQV